MVELVVDLRFKQSSELQGAYGDMHSRIHGQDDVGELIDQVQKRVPVKIRVIPPELTRELLEHSEKTRDHQAHQPSVGPHRVNLVIAARVLDDGESDE